MLHLGSPCRPLPRPAWRGLGRGLPPRCPLPPTLSIPCEPAAAVTAIARNSAPPFVPAVLCKSVPVLFVSYSGTQGGAGRGNAAVASLEPAAMEEASRGREVHSGAWVQACRDQGPGAAPAKDEGSGRRGQNSKGGGGRSWQTEVLAPPPPLQGEGLGGMAGAGGGHARLKIWFAFLGSGGPRPCPAVTCYLGQNLEACLTISSPPPLPTAAGPAPPERTPRRSAPRRRPRRAARRSARS
jgi:hypothetical protein